MDNLHATYDIECNAKNMCDSQMQSTEVLMSSLIQKNPYVTEYYRMLFNKCDKNGDGFVNRNELRRFIETQEEHDIPDHVIKTIHGSFDKNGDDLLDFEEFLEMINSPIVAKTFRRLRSRYLKFVVVVPSNPQRIRLQSTLSSTGLYDEEAKCKKTTVGMVTLSAIQILLYYINFISIKSFNSTIIEDALKFTPMKKYQIWRYVTHIFVHGSAMHLFPNVIIQILIGIPLEMVHGWRVLVIYVAGALGGCLAHSVIVPTPTAELVGGSGGFYAFYTAHISTVIMNWAEVTHPIVHLILFGTMTVFDPIYNYVIQQNMGDVSYIAHLGGAVVGLLLGVDILRNLRVTRNETIAWYVCTTSYVILMVVFIVLDAIKR